MTANQLTDHLSRKLNIIKFFYIEKIREAFHKTLSLPMDTPLVRQANAYDFSNSSASDRKLLVNPHEKVGKSGVNEGNPAFVQGYYAYHHYMQENFDDNGWGCAYRSLQTICSWFRLVMLVSNCS